MESKWVKKQEWIISEILTFKEETILCIMLTVAGMDYREEYFNDRETVEVFPYIAWDGRYTFGCGAHINRYKNIVPLPEHLMEVTYVQVIEALTELIKEK